jgi:hypothetical protein
MGHLADAWPLTGPLTYAYSVSGGPAAVIHPLATARHAALLVRGPSWSLPQAALYSFPCISIQSCYKVCGAYRYSTSAERRFWPFRTSAMQVAGYGLPRIHFLGTWVNKG